MGNNKRKTTNNLKNKKLNYFFRKMPRTLAMLLEAKRREKARIKREIRRNNGVRKNDMLKEIVERKWDMEELDLHITDRKWVKDVKDKKIETVYVLMDFKTKHEGFGSLRVVSKERGGMFFRFEGKGKKESLGSNLPPRNGLREISLRDIIPQADHLNKLLHLRKVVRKLQNMYIACKGVIDSDEWEDWGEKTMEHLRSNKTKGRSKVADRLREHNGVHYYKKCKPM